MRTMTMLVVLGVTLAACSSKMNGGAGGAASNASGGGAAPPGGSANCSAFCQILAGATCPMQVSVTDCEQGCRMTLATCPTDGARVVSCGIASGTVQCDANGFPAPAGCDAALQSLSACEQSSGSSGSGPSSSAGSGGTTSTSSNTSSSGSPTNCVPPNVGGCGFGVPCCTYPGSGSNPASVPVCHSDTMNCCIGQGDGCSDDSQCCVNLACVLSDPNNPSSNKFCN